MKDGKWSILILILVGLWALSSRKEVKAAAEPPEVELAKQPARMIVEAVPGMEAEAMVVVAEAGGTVETYYGSLIQAIVPTDKIRQLENQESVRLVREPMVPVYHF